MNDAQLESAILQYVSQAGYTPVKPRVIAQQLGLAEHLYRDARHAVKRLVKAGKLAYGPNHVVGLPTAAEMDRLTGVFRRTAKGHGYVAPAGVTRSDQREDIYIPERASADAASGDVVLVRIRGKRFGRGGPRLEGEIVQILERETHQFVGTYFEQGGMGLVDVDAGLFTAPVLVGDPGAKNARPNDKVVIDMVRFPSHTHDGEAVIVEVLGQRGQPGVDTLSIIREYSLPGDFPADVLGDAHRQAEKFDASIPRGRTDFTGKTMVTIDPVDARDFDDAISLERLDNGHWLLGVHIADVAHFVRLKSPLDREARDRATSVYLPDRVIPMLPEVISNNLASLQPGRVRFAKSVLIELTADGAHVDTEYHTSAIRSDRRFTYEEVDDWLAHPLKWKKELAPDVLALLGRMHELAMILRKRRFQRGALELSMREVKVDLDADGRVVGAHVVQNTESHQVIEEFMLAANEAVANVLKRAGLLFLRRVHQSPDPRKLKALTEFVTELGIQTESLESRFAIQQLLAEVEGKPEQHAVNYAVLRAMQRAVYSPMEEGHYALASECYCHFTSPIRRYPDLTVHRLLDALLAGKKPPGEIDDLVALGEHCSERERRAEDAERVLVKVKLLEYLSTRIGEEMDAVVTGVREFGLFVQGIELPAEGLVHVTSLADDYYRYDERSHTLAGFRSGNAFRLGDVVRVAVARVDVDRRELDFRVCGRRGRIHPAPSNRPARGKAKLPHKPKRPNVPRPPKKRGKRR
jgi:ribonuclease R